MAKNWEKLSKEEKEAITYQVSLQNYLASVADVDYQCYVEKISFSEFWDRYLFNKLKSRSDEL